MTTLSINVTLPREIYIQIEEHCIRKGITQSEFFLDLVKPKFQTQEKDEHVQYEMNLEEQKKPIKKSRTYQK